MHQIVVASAAIAFLTACGGGGGANNGAAAQPAAPVNAAQVGPVANAAAAQAAGPEAPLIARCHMGGCSWFRIESRATVREQGGERLLRISMVEGGSEHPGDTYPTSARGVAIRWSPPAADTWFLCSARRPTAIMGQDSAFAAVPLDFVNGPYGPTEAVSAQYVAACHPGDDMNRAGFAGRHGYRAAGEGAETRTLARPEDVFTPAG